MFALLLLDHRLAFLFLALLLLGAAIPIAIAWARLLPEDPPPFDSKRGSARETESISIYMPEGFVPRDPFAVFLLVCVTLSYILQFPGLPGEAVIRWLATVVPNEVLSWILLAGRAFFVVTPGLAACYSALRQNPLRAPLIAAGILVLLLWLLVPLLHAAFLAGL